ncbi:hypothetical protein FACS189413_19940 [Bacteroidia bacterium]|nr:hypothetical protein FACS189413_19940 [Bacteroidia bacterium]
MSLKNCIGKIFESVLLEWFYLNNIPISIVRLYIKVNSYFDITCCEENVFIKEQKDIPNTTISHEFIYKPIEQHIEWLHHCKVISIKYLIDSKNIRRGILFMFEHDHNFAFYNKGYEYDDNDVFEIDINTNSVFYDLIDI